MEIPNIFLCSVYVSRHVQSFKGFGKNLLKLELFKDKTLIRTSVYNAITTKTGQYPVPLTQDENRLYQKLQRSHL